MSTAPLRITEAPNPRTAHARAVGAGLTHAIMAVSAPLSPEEWVHFCLTAADEAEAAVNENPPRQQASTVIRLLHELAEPEDPEYGQDPEIDAEALRAAARAAGSAAFRAAMPKLTGRRTTQAYIACVAAGLQRGYFSGADAKALLYTAQLALAAWPKRQQKRGGKESK